MHREIGPPLLGKATKAGWEEGKMSKKRDSLKLPSILIPLLESLQKPPKILQKKMSKIAESQRR